MYACICHAVTEDAVRACAGGGFRHVVDATRAGSGCGTCVNRLRGLLQQPCVPSTTVTSTVTAAEVAVVGVPEPSRIYAA